tara:strand:+ start:629 stop:808 length:180 start_codon:yes stop_codon:yes gene_type:complete
MNFLLKQYIDSLQLNFLWRFQNESYYEDWRGKIIGLKQIEKQFNELSEKELDKLEVTIY